MKFICTKCGENKPCKLDAIGSHTMPEKCPFIGITISGLKINTDWQIDTTEEEKEDDGK